MPVGNVLVCNARCNIKHDDTTLPIDVVTISQTTEFLLASGIPHIEVDLAKILM